MLGRVQGKQGLLSPPGDCDIDRYKRENEMYRRASFFPGGCWRGPHLLSAFLFEKVVLQLVKALQIVCLVQPLFLLWSGAAPVRPRAMAHVKV